MANSISPPARRPDDGLPTLEPVSDAVVSAPVLDPIVVAQTPVELPTLESVPWNHGGFFATVVRLALAALYTLGSIAEWLLGVAVLLGGLAYLSAIPVLQFLSLGYLLEAGARVARTGRIRDAFVGVRLAARIGGIVAATWVLLIPVRIVSGLAMTAHVIDPGGPNVRAWRLGLFVLIGLTAVHVLAACARGGKIRHFLWPFNVFWLVGRLRRGGYYAESRDRVWDTVMALRLPHYFSLGFRGFLAALAWLALPVTLMVVGHAPNPVAPLVGWLGAFLLMWVLLYLPFLQLRMAQHGRFRAAFELSAVRADFKKAPWTFTLAFAITLLTALPLYLLKIEMIPQEAAWLPGLVFISFIFPARVLTGYALSHASRREKSRHWFWRWMLWPIWPAVVVVYVGIAYVSVFTSWNGLASLYEQHAFLVPVPFFGM